ncbi:uncharacterized protein LOC131884068 [Tigriopus californicus]|uniref:uncharacterized protein LOC131884068 n=1 Tax=Tigriopus californicus TaxID=6832 RepID=UPI0027DA5A63|nr:uncharacterized protein LOC131884068 [Tigriopus californicus]
MSDREAVQVLKASRKGFKAALSRARNVAESAFEDYVEGERPTLLERFVNHWDDRLQKYLQAQDQVVCHLSSDSKDADPAVEEHLEALFKAQSKLIGFQRDVEASLLRAAGEHRPHPSRESGQTLSLPRLDAKKPPLLQEDTDHKVFTRWRPLWDNYSLLIYLDQRDQLTQVGLFWECCSSGFLSIIQHSLGIKTNTGRTVVEILDLIEEHLRSLRNIHLDMRDLLAVRQKEGQDYLSFCNSLRELADYADAAKITEDRLLIALLLQGMKNDSDKAKVMERNPSTFNEARKCILELETARRGARDFSHQSSSLTVGVLDQVVHVTKSKYKKNGGKSGKMIFNKTLPSEQCPLCGLSKTHSREDCPALKSSCHACGRTGHWQPVCRQKSPSRREEKRAGGVHLRVASSSTRERENRINVMVSPHKSSKSVSLQFCADTGADVIIIGMNQFRDSDICQLTTLDQRSSNSVISGVDGRSLSLVGSFRANLSLDEDHKAHDVTIVVSYDVDDSYLSLDACRALGIVGPNFPQPMISVIEREVVRIPDPTVWSLKEREEWITSLPSLPSREDFMNVESKLKSIYSTAFDDSSLKPMRGPIVGDPMVITLKEGARSFAINTAHQIPIPQLDPVKSSLDKMVDSRIIEPVGDIPTPWCHPLVVVPKPDGSLRLCVDLTRLNTEVVRSIHPIKTPAEAICGFKPRDKYFIKLDLVKGYWQMPLAKESQELTTFITPFGKYRFLRSPMGFISTGDSFSYRGDVAMSGLGIQKVIDDMAVGKELYPDLVRVTCDILERCVRFGMTVNAKKSVIGGAEEIDFVGYRISRDSIKADPEKVAAISRFPCPEDRQDLRSFMGLVNQLGQFSSEIAHNAEPLRDLLKIKNVFSWCPEHMNAFEKVKSALTSPPILGMFQLGAETILQTDASKLKGLGFALMQLHEEWKCGKQHYIPDALSRYPISDPGSWGGGML